jgi:hypothetical protein
MTSRSRGAPLRPSYEQKRIVSGEWKSIRNSPFARHETSRKDKAQVVVPAFLVFATPRPGLFV